jgi:mannose-6-phosphate isomerase class I
MSEKDRQKNLPFLLRPAGKDYLWGGSRLNDDFSKNIPMEPLAETWECSTHPDGPSIVDSGEYKGKLLSDLLHQHPEFLGTHPRSVLSASHLREDELPILIKFIDAKQDLSIQVHPDDAYAYEKENGQLGKTEMWYVLDATKDACLTYGLVHDMDKEQVKKAIAEKKIGRYLQKVHIKKDDVFTVDAGTIHAIGAGALIAEIQESSNLTYRLYDYDRVDKHGKKRELQIEKALDVANLHASSEPAQPMRVLKYTRGCAIEFLSRCRYFQVERLLLNTERIREMLTMSTDETSFMVLLCVDGCGMLSSGTEAISFFKGDCIFIPADSAPIKLHGTAQFLKVNC